VIQELSIDKKEPRFLNGFPEPIYRPIEGVNVLWRDHVFSEVVEISLAGIIVKRPSHFVAPKNSKLMEIRLQVPGLELTQGFEVTLERLTDSFIYFLFDINSPKSRLLIEQNHKDQLIMGHLQVVPLRVFENPTAKSLWVHGPFETNFYFWLDANNQIQRWVLEYDNMLLFADGQRVWQKRSSLSKNSNQSYVLFNEDFEYQGPKVGIGNTWLSRVTKIIESFQGNLPFNVQSLLLELKNHRTH
jgi:hypothetical protein